MAGAEGHLVGTMKQTLTENAGADPVQLALEAWDPFAFLSVRCAGSVGVLTAPPASLITFLPPAVALAATPVSRRC